MPHVEARSQRPLPYDVLNQRRLFHWIASLEQGAVNDDLRSQASYIRTVNIVFLTTPEEERLLASHASLSNLLIQTDQRAEGFHSFNVEDDGPLELGARSLAEEWLKTHPESKPAQMIALRGLNASSRMHFRFIAEIYQEARV